MRLTVSLMSCLCAIVVLGCTSSSSQKLTSHIEIEKMQSSNYSQRIKSLVMHFTAINYQESVTALVDEGGLSAHYLVPELNDPTYPQKSLKVLQLVDENKRAWHAGVSYWQGREGLNDHSIGIEIVNVPYCARDELLTANQALTENSPNRLCVFPDFDPAQIALIIQLSKQILARNPDITPTAVVGHSDIAPSRKNDPGPRFPWYQLYKEGIGAWYDNETLEKYWRLFNESAPSTGLVQRALNTYGYGIDETGRVDQQTIDTLSAFQMHFLPWSVNGEINTKTAAAVFALLEKYFPDKLESLINRYLKEQPSQVAVLRPQQQGQLSARYPSENRSSRTLVNDRAVFKAYAGRGQLIVESEDAKNADIYINGEKIGLSTPFVPYQPYTYSLAKRTKTGSNTLWIDNVVPADSHFNITIPYPSLKDNVESYSEAFHKVDKLINQEIENGFPGAVVMVIKDGQVIKRSAYGYARKFDEHAVAMEKPQKMTTDTLFDLASNTKMFTTTLALMKLVSEGLLNLENPIQHYLPEYRGNGREFRLVEDLLSHRSGYSADIQFFKPDNKAGTVFYSQQKSLTETLLIQKLPFEASSGGDNAYSDINYMILGLLIERITGSNLDDYVEQNIYQTLGLQRTVFNPLQKGLLPEQIAATEINGNTRGGNIGFPNIRHHVLQGEVHDEKAFYSMGGVSGHAGLFSNADELAVLAQLMLNGGGYHNIHLFDSTTLAQFIKPNNNSGYFGLGWRRAAQGNSRWHFGPYASERAYGHTGWTGTATVIDPEHDLAIILLTNMRHSTVKQTRQGHFHFAGADFETGKYGSIISLIYEAILEKN